MGDQIIHIYSQVLMPMIGWVTFWYALSIMLKRNDIVDIAWGLGYIYFSFWVAIHSEHGLLQYFIFGLIFLWGARLAIYLFFRNRGKKEDFRYKQWREDWDKSFYLRSFFQVYVLQTLLLMIIALPIVIASINSQMELKWTVIPGAFLWLIGFYWQTKGDAQLMRFKKNPENRGKIIQIGLWAKSRHPNYFGELCMWWGVWICLSTYPMGWLALISPLLISYLIIKVSGIPMLEAKYDNNPDFQSYKKRVPVLVPKFGKQKN